jgi:transposase
MKGKVLVGIALLSGLSLAQQPQTNSVGFANFFYQKGYEEGYKQGYEKGYKLGYLQALQDAKVLLRVANKKIQAVKSGCELLEEKFGQSLAIIAVEKNGKYYLKPFISDLNVVENWKDLVEFDIPLVKNALLTDFSQASQRVLSIPELDREGSVETEPPKKEYITKLPKSALEYLKKENIPFVVIKDRNEVIAVFNSKTDYEQFCNIYKVCGKK